MPMVGPDEVLMAFIREMNAWELRCSARKKKCVLEASFEVSKATGIREYAEIFERYCSPSRALPRGYCYSEPPDYDPDAEVILSTVEIGPGLVEIRSENRVFREKHIFLLCLEDGRWRLVSKKIEINRDIISDSVL